MSKFSGYQRISKAQEYDEVLGGGKKQVDRLLVALAKRSSDHAEQLRFGIIVSKKVGQAHVRNKVKRRLREIFRQISSTRSARRPCKVVFIARGSVTRASFQEIKSSVLRILTHLERKMV